MKSKAVISAFLVVCLASGGVSFAQGNRDRDDRGRNEQGQQDGRDHRDNDRRHDNDGRRDRGDDRQHSDRDRHEYGDSHDNARREDRGAGPNHAFHRGQRLPPEYNNRHYVVDDWRGYHLSAPPRGYHWIQTGGDYVLVAITTGIILQLLLNN